MNYKQISTSDVWCWIDAQYAQQAIDREEYQSELCELRRQAQGEVLKQLADHLKELEEIDE